MQNFLHLLNSPHELILEFHNSFKCKVNLLTYKRIVIFKKLLRISSIKPFSLKNIFHEHVKNVEIVCLFQACRGYRVSFSKIICKH